MIEKFTKSHKNSPKKEYISRIKLYRASSNSPVSIDNTAKEEIRLQRDIMNPPSDAFLRIDARCKDLMDERQLEVYFDPYLDRGDMVFFDNKMLFTMDPETSKLLMGRTLSFFSGEFALLANGITQIYTEPGDLPTC